MNGESETSSSSTDLDWDLIKEKRQALEESRTTLSRLQKIAEDAKETRERLRTESESFEDQVQRLREELDDLTDRMKEDEQAAAGS